MDESKAGRILSEEIDETIQKAYAEFARIMKNHRRGLLSEDSTHIDMDQIFYENSFDYIRDRGFRIFRETSDAKKRYKEEWELWKRGETPLCDQGDEWLFYDNLDDIYDDKSWLDVIRSFKYYGLDTSPTETPASPYDKIQIFRLLDAFQIDLAPSYLERPEGMASPDRYITHTYNGGNKIVVGFQCVDDGGLLADISPTGKTFRLKNDLGLTAEITIKEVRAPEERFGMDEVDDYAPRGTYLGEGYIEGYTATEQRRLPEITIRTDDNGRIVKLGTSQVWEDDLKAFSEFSLWQEYFCWMGAADEQDQRNRYDFYERF